MIAKALREIENQKYKILIVEDNPHSLEQARSILQREGHTVLAATNAGETLTILDNTCLEGKVCIDKTCQSQNCFDAVLIDYDLKDVTGGTLGAFIRHKFKDIAIILFSSYGKLPAIVKAAEAINAKIITKPLDAEELIREIGINVAGERLNKKPVTSSVTADTIRHILKLTTSRNLQQT